MTSTLVSPPFVCFMRKKATCLQLMGLCKTRSYFQRAVYTVTVALSLSVTALQTTPCSVCGDLGPPSVPLPGKFLPDYGLPIPTCFSLETSAILLEEGSPLCIAIQTLGSYCGCNIAADACTLCWDGTPVPNKNITLPNYLASDFSFGGLGAGIVLDCEGLETLLHSVNNSTERCLSARFDVGETCGCSSIPENEVIVENPLDPTQINKTDPEEPETTPFASCSLCKGGEPPPVPDRLVELGTSNLLSCAQWNALSSSLEEGSSDCLVVRSLSRLCECPKQPGECTMCPLDEPIPKPEAIVSWLDQPNLSTDTSTLQSRIVSYRATCELIDSFVGGNIALAAEISAIDEGLVCTATQMKSWICGCKPDWRPIVLTWCYRVSGMLSFVVSI